MVERSTHTREEKKNTKSTGIRLHSETERRRK